jgi:hypothetical protein
MNLSDTLWLVGEVEPGKREDYLAHMGEVIGDIRAYHVTSSTNATQIKRNGLEARSSRQSYDRPSAAYFFLDRSEIDEESKAILLDDPKDAVVIEVTIPRDEFLAKVKYDGLYNASFNSYSAIQFLDNVPANWIK